MSYCSCHIVLMRGFYISQSQGVLGHDLAYKIILQLGAYGGQTDKAAF